MDPDPQSQYVIIQRRPLILSEHDIHLTDTARRKARVRKLLKLLAFLAAPLFIAQSLAFVSFIYEEALQAASFGVRSGLQCQDAAIAIGAIQNFERVMRDAQRFQERWGCMAFWSHQSFHSYFHIVAPTQLVGFYAEGKKRRLWHDDPRRWCVVDDPIRGPTRIDMWERDPIGSIKSFGFDPALVKPKKGGYRTNLREMMDGSDVLVEAYLSESRRE